MHTTDSFDSAGEGGSGADLPFEDPLRSHLPHKDALQPVNSGASLFYSPLQPERSPLRPTRSQAVGDSTSYPALPAQPVSVSRAVAAALKDHAGVTVFTDTSIFYESE